jgi:hypothetical protein
MSKSSSGFSEIVGFQVKVGMKQGCLTFPDWTTSHASCCIVKVSEGWNIVALDNSVSVYDKIDSQTPQNYH